MNKIKLYLYCWKCSEMLCLGEYSKKDKKDLLSNYIGVLRTTNVCPKCGERKVSVFEEIYIGRR